MTQGETIAYYHPLLYSIAYKMVGTVMDAEDIVQDTFLKWLKVEHEKIHNTKAYLVKSVTNSCINHLNQINKKKESLVEFIHASSISDLIDLSKFDLKAEISVAISVLMKKLEPAERAVFVLREIFNVEYTELTDILDKKKDHLRQIMCRAKDKLNQEKERFSLNLENHDQFVSMFRNACNFGDLNQFIDNLKKDISEKIQKL